MERHVRAHFRVIRVNRWGLALAILVALALLLLPGSRFLAASGAPAQKIRPGVTIGTRDFSGRTEAEAKAMLVQMAETFRGKPNPAYEAKAAEGYQYVIPEVNGYELDVDATWTKLITADDNTRVEPATRVVPPAKKLNDFPKAIIRHGNPAKRAVGLLINVDWGNDELAQMLDILKTRGARATFFVSGRWAGKNPDLMAKIVAGGHEVATHGQNLTEDGPKGQAQRGQLRNDIETSVKVIQQATGLPVRYYAPHMSQISPEILKTADDLKLRTVLYSIDTRDWMETTTTNDIMDDFRKALPGDLILLHPTPNTAKVLGEAVLNLQTRGLTPVTLSELLSPEPETSSFAPHHAGQ